MNEVFADFKGLAESDPRLGYIMASGGVITIATIDQIYTDTGTPFIAFLDGGVDDVLHWSGARRWMPFQFKVVVGQSVMEREGVIAGSPQDKGIDEIAKDVRNVFDMERFNGKYARNFLKSESEPELMTEGNVHLIIKTLTFEIVRIE